MITSFITILIDLSSFVIFLLIATPLNPSWSPSQPPPLFLNFLSIKIPKKSSALIPGICPHLYFRTLLDHSATFPLPQFPPHWDSRKFLPLQDSKKFLGIEILEIINTIFSFSSLMLHHPLLIWILVYFWMLCDAALLLPQFKENSLRCFFQIPNCHQFSGRYHKYHQSSPSCSWPLLQWRVLYKMCSEEIVALKCKTANAADSVAKHPICQRFCITDVRHHCLTAMLHCNIKWDFLIKPSQTLLELPPPPPHSISNVVFENVQQI